MLGRLIKKNADEIKEGKWRIKADRITAIRVVIFLLATVFILRLFNLQVIGYEDYKAAADGSHVFFEKLYPKRGDIYLREKGSEDKDAPYLIEVNGQKLFPAVTDREYKMVYAVPRVISEVDKTIEKLAPILQIGTKTPENPEDEAEKEAVKKENEEELAHFKAKLEKENDSYEVIKKKLTDEQVEEIEKLDLKGIYFSTETYRYYPEKLLGGQLFGYVGHVAETIKGAYGLEGYFNDILKGREGSLEFETDVVGALIPVGERHVKEAEDGASLILTIDRVVQMTVCKRLKDWVEQYQAESGTVIIMDPQTGAVIAMCSVPDFEPANYGQHPLETYNNPAIFTPWEPGSIFKPITMSMALDMGKVMPNTTYEDTGEVKIGVDTIRNSDKKANGVQTMTDVLNKSLNTGTVHVANIVGKDAFKKYVKAYGFGSLSGIEMDTEVPGNLNALDLKGDIYLATSSFGQGITTTPLQIVLAFSAIANGGKLMQPYVVDEIIKSDGNTVTTEPKMIRQVVSERAATLLSGMLVTVVRNGHGDKAGVDNYYVAGKTGTAQVAKKHGGGYEAGATIGSFVGFAPVDNPKFTMLVKIDKPKSAQWAASYAAPLFGDIAKFLLNYYEIPPDEEPEEE